MASRSSSVPVATNESKKAFKTYALREKNLVEDHWLKTMGVSRRTFGKVVAQADVEFNDIVCSRAHSDDRVFRRALGRCNQVCAASSPVPEQNKLSYWCAALEKTETERQATERAAPSNSDDRVKWDDHLPSETELKKISSWDRLDRLRKTFGKHAVRVTRFVDTESECSSEPEPEPEEPGDQQDQSSTARSSKDVEEAVAVQRGPSAFLGRFRRRRLEKKSPLTLTKNEQRTAWDL